MISNPNSRWDFFDGKMSQLALFALPKRCMMGAISKKVSVMGKKR